LELLAKSSHLMNITHTDGASSANLNLAKAPERNGKCRDGSGNDIANDHDLGRVGGYEFRRHAVLCREYGGKNEIHT
jgi:hypothetical protein